MVRIQFRGHLAGGRSESREAASRATSSRSPVNVPKAENADARLAATISAMRRHTCLSIAVICCGALAALLSCDAQLVPNHNSQNVQHFIVAPPW